MLRVRLFLASSLLSAALAPLGLACSSSDGADAGTPDAGALADTGAADTGAPTDGGTAPDAAMPDAGPARLTVYDIQRPVAVSPDGRTALLWQQSTGELLFVDVATGASRVVTTLDTTNLQTQQPNALSNAGHIAAIYGSQPGEAGLWNEAGGWRRLGSPLEGCVDTSTMPPRLNDLGAAFDVSADGRAVVGLLWKSCTQVQAFKWVGGNFQLLTPLGVGPDLMTPDNNRATVISADGMVAAGFAFNGSADRSPAVWNPDGTGFLLDPTDRMLPGEVTAISADGAIVAGTWARPMGGSDGFVWSRAGGVVRFSPTENADQTTLFVTSMRADGQQVFGRSSFQASFFDPVDAHAFVWSAARGLRRVGELAAALGVTLPANAKLTSVQGASDDGTVFVGELQLPPDAQDPLQLPVLKTYVLVVPPGALD